MQAIRLYEQAVAQAKRDRALAAQALIGMADAYGKLGNAESQKIYERVVQEFGDQKEAAAVAQNRLTASRAPSSSRRSFYSGEGVDAISPDGRWATFADWSTGGDLAVRDLISGTKRQLTRRPEGSSQSYADGSIISPDGKQVAYLWIDLPEFEFQVRIVPIEGGASPQIVHRSKNYLFVEGWTPNNEKLLVTRSLDDGTWQIAMLWVKGGAMQPLKTFSWSKIGVSLSPDGRYVAYERTCRRCIRPRHFRDGNRWDPTRFPRSTYRQRSFAYLDARRFPHSIRQRAGPRLHLCGPYPSRMESPTGEAQIVQSDIGRH